MVMASEAVVKGSALSCGGTASGCKCTCAPRPATARLTKVVE
jgi:hypothetical protein